MSSLGPKRAHAIALAGIMIVMSQACSRAVKRAEPVASLSHDPQAAAEMTMLREAWDTHRLERAAVEAFLARHPNDGAAPLAKIYLAFLLMDAGKLGPADGVLSELARLPPGTTNDLAVVARARSLRLHNAPQSALDSLRPLVGKIVDDADREVFLEEVALAALAAHDDYEALAYLDAWLRGVGEDDKDRVKEKIAQILSTLPRPVLEQTYRTMRASGTASGYGVDTQKLVAERLAHIAVETNDAALARWLVDVSGVSAAQTGGDAGLELSELAASRRGLATVAGRTVGLLLPTRDRDLRDEAADVVRGVSWALDLPRSAGTEGARLVVREDGVDLPGTRTAMEELAGEGATIIVAGFDRASADRASIWSEETQIPVLLLAAPSPAHLPKRGGAVLGERTEREIAMLADALLRHRATTVAFIADAADDEASARFLRDGHEGLTLLPPVKCDIPLAEAGKTRFPIDSWWRAGARGWLVSGPSACARDLLRDIASTSLRVAAGAPLPAVALTLEAGIPMNEVTRGVTILSASAGLMPVLASRPEEAADDEIRAFMSQLGVRPSFWTALGHDAGKLAKAALAPLSLDTTTDEKAVDQRRGLVRSGLISARARMWTSDAKGIGADRVLERSLRIVSWDRGK